MTPPSPPRRSGEPRADAARAIEVGHLGGVITAPLRPSPLYEADLTALGLDGVRTAAPKIVPSSGPAAPP